MRQPTFAVVFCRGHNLRDRVVIASNLPTVEAARDARKVSGDVVIDERTGKLVRSFRWLWEWEKHQPTTFSRELMRHVR